MGKFNFKSFILIMLSISTIGTAKPAQGAAQHQQKRVVRPAKPIGKKTTTSKKTELPSLQDHANTALASLKRFTSLDYLRYCDCPNHQKNQTLRNQIRRHPGRAIAYLATGLSAGALLLFGGLSFWNPKIHSGGNPPQPPIDPDPAPIVNPVNPEPPILAEVAPLQLEEHQEQQSYIFRIPQPVIQIPPMNHMVPAHQAHIDQLPEDLPEFPNPLQPNNPALLEAVTPLIPLKRIVSIPPQRHMVAANQKAIDDLNQEPEIPGLIMPFSVVEPNNDPEINLDIPMLAEVAPLQLEEHLEQQSYIFRIPQPMAVIPKDKGEEYLANSWTELSLVIEADKTPGLGALASRENWNRLCQLGQLASGNLEPIIDFMQQTMPKESHNKLLEISQELYSKVTFALERDCTCGTIEFQPAIIKQQLRNFQETIIPNECWCIATNSYDEDEIKKFKAFFWLREECLLEEEIKKTGVHKSRDFFAQLKQVEREIAQEVLIDQAHVPAQVYVRSSGGISGQEHDWIQKRLPRVLEAQRRIIKVRINDQSFDLPKPVKIGICMSGGGYRAMTFSAGFLSGLEKLGIIDSALYVSGLSGSTWFLMRWLMSQPSAIVCKDELKKVIPKANLLCLFAEKEKLDLPRLVQDVIIPKAAFNKPITSTDLYGGLLARALLQDCTGQKRHRLTLADFAERIDSAEYPFPICTAISATDSGINGAKSYHWFEYNPYEVEDNTTGLAIPAHAYGCKFQNGKIVQSAPPECIGSMAATWGSAYAINFVDEIDESKISGLKKNAADTFAQWFMPQGIYENGRISATKIYNPWYQLPESKKKEAFKSVEQAQAMSEAEYCTLVDAGIDFNLPLIPLLKRMRDLDVVIVGDASGSGKIMEEILMPDGKTKCPKELAKFFCKVAPHGIIYERKRCEKQLPNFSIYVPQNGDTKHKPTWIEGHKLPVIIYFNFITDPEMIELGLQNPELKKLIRENNLEQFNAQKCLKEYGFTFNFEYSSDDFKQLAAVGELNVLQHKDEIYQELSDAFYRSSRFI